MNKFTLTVVPAAAIVLSVSAPMEEPAVAQSCVPLPYLADWDNNCPVGAFQRNNYVAGLQGINIVQGREPGPRDGLYSSYDYNAITSFQSKNGLAVDGIVGPQTWHAYRNQIAYVTNVDSYWEYQVPGSYDVESAFYRYNALDLFYGIWYIVPNNCCGFTPFSSSILQL